MIPLTIGHATGEYPVYIESGILQSLPQLLARHCPDRRPVIITDETVARLVRHPLVDVPCITFPPGEASKTRSEWERLTDALLGHSIGRDGAVIALGGGVTGDLAAFVASTYHRGLPVVQVPTTLLAMIDASIGGKTGVDTLAGKNLVGTFHQPVAVVTDPTVLETLPDRELRSGMSEAVKHALIADPGLFEWLGRHASALLSVDASQTEELVRRSVTIKAAVVEHDERESGRRAILNAGHTVAHALEAESQYQLSHGEAVAIGLVVECKVAERMGICETRTALLVSELLSRFALPISIPASLSPDSLIERMMHDKKNRRGIVRCALVSAIGHVAGSSATQWTQEVDLSLLREVLAAATEATP